MRVLVFGDSITQGFWDSEGGWVARIRRTYDKAQVADMHRDEPVVFNLGISADTSKDVLARFEAETAARKRRHELAFVFAIGVNDACYEKSKSNPEAFRKNVQQLISMAEKHSPRVLVVGLTPADEDKTTPVFWGDFHYRNEDIRKFDDIVRGVCKEQDVTFVPVFDVMKDRVKELMPDGLHPNDKGHELIAKLVKPELDKLLG